jgi:predicted phosphodiesterase
MGASALAVVADIHGNSWALEAVLADMERRGIRRVVNLGDCFYGPLDPRGTFELLRQRHWPTVRGNQDRVLLEQFADGDRNATLDFVLHELGPEGLEWTRSRTEPSLVIEALLACHGTPDRDDEYLVEAVTPGGIELRTPAEVDDDLGELDVDGVLCGHSHVPRLIRSQSGRLVLNPGSVGLPAYEDDAPFLHAMEAGSPHARYAVIEGEGRERRTSFVAVPYDVEAAARTARKRGRPDWEAWLTLGRAP